MIHRRIRQKLEKDNVENELNSAELDSEISLLSLKRLQYLKDVNIFPWFKRQQNLLRLVVFCDICKRQYMFHLFTSLMFSYLK